MTKRRPGKQQEDNTYIKRDPATGIITREEWYRGERRHRADGPARIERDAETGVVTFEEWWENGKQDRADGPANIDRDAVTVIATYEEWCKDGQSDRADGPAVIMRGKPGRRPCPHLARRHDRHRHPRGMVQGR